MGCPRSGGPGLLAFAPAARFGRRGRLLGLGPGRNRLGLGPPLAARRLLLLVALGLRLDAGLRGVRHAFALLGRLAQRRLPARLPDQVRGRGGEERRRADRVVIAGERHADQVRGRVALHDRDHRDPELVRLRHRDTLLLRVHHEQCAREPAHVLDAGEVLLELQTLAVEQQLLFLGVVLELTLADPLLQILQPLDLLLDRLEVRERTTQPALGHVERAAALRLRLEDVLELLLGADEQDALTLQHHAAQELLRGVVLKGEGVLFVCTKKQLKNILQAEAERCGAFYVTERWLGGTLTNFQTIKKQIKRLKDLEQGISEGEFEHHTKKEQLLFNRERLKLEKYLSGIKNMGRLPGALFVVDSKKERIAVAEANKLGIPVVAIVDTNADPDLITVPIPGNDDAIRAVSLIAAAISDVIGEARRQMPLREAAEEGEGVTYSTETGVEAEAEGDKKKKPARRKRRPKPEAIAARLKTEEAPAPAESSGGGEG